MSGTVGEKLVADLCKNTKADKDAIGVFALDSGRVVKKPKAQNVPVSHRLELMKEAFFMHNMKSSKMWL